MYSTRIFQRNWWTHSMTDYDSNPFADPEAANPFQVSLVNKLKCECRWFAFVYGGPFAGELVAGGGGHVVQQPSGSGRSGVAFDQSFCVPIPHVPMHVWLKVFCICIKCLKKTHHITAFVCTGWLKFLLKRLNYIIFIILAGQIKNTSAITIVQCLTVASWSFSVFICNLCNLLFYFVGRCYSISWCEYVKILKERFNNKIRQINYILIFILN